MKTYTISLNDQQLQLLQDALFRLPYGTVAPLIAHINNELQKAHDIAKDQQPPSGAQK